MSWQRGELAECIAGDWEALSTNGTPRAFGGPVVGTLYAVAAVDSDDDGLWLMIEGLGVILWEAEGFRKVLRGKAAGGAPERRRRGAQLEVAR